MGKRWVFTVVVHLHVHFRQITSLKYRHRRELFATVANFNNGAFSNCDRCVGSCGSCFREAGSRCGLTDILGQHKGGPSMPLSADVNKPFNYLFPPKLAGNGDRKRRLTCVQPPTGCSTSPSVCSPSPSVCVCVCAREGGRRRPLTGESKENAHSLLKTRSPVLGTLMVGM